MDPANRRTRRPSIRRLRPLDAFVVVAICALALGMAMPWLGLRWPGGAGSSSSRLGGMTGEEEVMVALLDVAQEKALEHVVLQLDREPEFGPRHWPDAAAPWGHVPELTLFDDGTLVYLRELDTHSEAPIPYATTLTPHGVQVLVDRVEELGFDRLIGVNCRAGTATDGTSIGPPGPGYTIVRLRREGIIDSRCVFEGQGFGRHPAELFDITDFLWESMPGDDTPLASSLSVLHDALSGPAQSWTAQTAIEAEESQQHLESLDDPDGADFGDRLRFMEPMEPIDWPVAIPMPARFPAPFSGDAMRIVHGKVVELAQQSHTEVSRMPKETLAQSSSFWAWTFRLLNTDGSTRETRLIAVPWIYGDRYPDVERDIEAYVRAMEAAAVARRDADATAIAAEPADREWSDAPATMAPPEGAVDTFNDLYIDPSDATPVWNRFPPELTPDPLPFGLGVQVWEHWTNDGTEAALRRLSEETAPSLGWLKQRFAWADLEPFGPTLLDDNPQIMHPDHWLAAVSSPEPGRRRVLIQLDVPPEWARNESSGAGDPPFDLTAWAGFVREFASRYAGLVDAYEIMNEPNLAQAWGAEPDPAAYAKVLAAAFRAIKMADPQAVVVSAGLAPTGTDLPEAMADDIFLQGLYNAMDAEGGSALYFDALGAHAPGFAAAPSVSPDEAEADPALGGQRTFTFRRVEDLRRIMVERGDEAKQIVVTEFGWTTDARPESPYTWSAVTEMERAAYIRDAYDFARDNWIPWIGPMILFTAADPAWTPDHEAWWWSVTEPGGGLSQEIRDAFAGD